jgi:hypothetical protein
MRTNMQDAKAIAPTPAEAIARARAIIPVLAVAPPHPDLLSRSRIYPPSAALFMTELR